MCFILIVHFFSFIFFLMNTEMTKNQCHKGILFTFIHHTGLNSHAYGMNCSSQCPFPSFGVLCSDTCLCNVTECNHVNGCRKELQLVSMLIESQLLSVCYCTRHKEIHWSNAHNITVLFVLQNNKDEIQCIFYRYAHFPLIMVDSLNTVSINSTRYCMCPYICNYLSRLVINKLYTCIFA